MKQNISFRLDKSKYRQFVDVVGGEPSKFIQMVIDAVVEQQGDMTSKLDAMRLRLASMRIARQILLLRLRELDKKISELEEHIKEYEKVTEEARRDQKFSELIQRLNTIIRECNYEFTCSWEHTAGVRAELEEIGFVITREWMLRQIERLLTWG